jgi:ornithine cyclodeaminase/alanine dehydrogenase-like protein (mu-crystallin family)
LSAIFGGLGRLQERQDEEGVNSPPDPDYLGESPAFGLPQGKILVLNRAEVELLLDLDLLRIALGRAMQQVSLGQVSVPERIAAIVPERGLLYAMPAYLHGDSSLAIKIVSLFPGNAGMGLATHEAVIFVFAPDTGRPIALMDGTWITAVRTAAGSALSADLLARDDSRTLAILGTGVQARAHAHAMVRIRPIETIRVAGRNLQRAEVLAAELQTELSIEATSVESYSEACREADIVCATTHSPVPVVQLDFLRPGTHVTSVGYNTEGREIDSATVANALVVVESRKAALAAPPAGSNDLLIPISEGLIDPKHIYAEIGELVAGHTPGRTSPDQITFYKSVGIAAEDVVAATLVIEAARSVGAGRLVSI